MGGNGKQKALGYTRVSTAEQLKGFGLEVQEHAIKEWCRANDVRLVDVLSDAGQSGAGGLEVRVGLADALGRLKDGEAQMLVVARLDRLARDLVVQETLIAQLHRQGNAVVSASEDIDTADDTPTRKLVRQIVGAVAEYERAVIRARVLAGRRAKMAKGGYGGGRPAFGYRVEDGVVVADALEQEAVVSVQRLRAAGASLREIAATLERQGVRPRGGGERWHPNSIRRVLARA